MMQRGWLILLLLLGACAGGQRAAPPRSTAAAPPSPSPSRAPGAVKIGKPYQVFGIWYYPADDRDYDETGTASWYGPGFHALSTANGERYEQDALSAAHKTLPLPSYVEVENLDNGRRLTVRINDRGPFVTGRIIDLSRRSAQLLGVDRPGTARVRVRRVYPDAATIAALQPTAPASPPPPPVIVAAAPVTSVMPSTAPPEPLADAEPAPVRSVAIPAAVLPSAGQRFVQVAALSDAGRVAWLSGYLAPYGPVVTETTASGLTRVRLGPYNDVDSATAALSRLRAAGYTEARLVTIGAGR